MIETALSILENYGLPLLFLGLTVYYLYYTVKSHRKERGEWRQDQVKMSDRYDERQAESTAVLRQLTAVIEHIQNNK